jgi:hypothetical protein
MRNPRWYPTLAFALVAACTPAAQGRPSGTADSTLAADWRELDPGSAWDANSVVRTYVNTLVARTRHAVAGDPTADHVIVLQEVDCTGRRGRLLSMTYHDAAGAPVRTDSGPPGDWVTVMPAMPADRFVTEVCAYGARLPLGGGRP